MNSTRLVTRASALLVLTAAAHAQAINIDVGILPLFGTPSDAYGAAAGQAGTWNAVIPGTISFSLMNTDGAPTLADIVASGGSPFQNDNPATSGDDQALMDDISCPATGITWTLSGLIAGEYDVYTYAWAPDTPLFRTEVTVNGEPSQIVGGVWVPGHELGTTYALHSITVAAGQAVTIVTAPSPGSNFGAVNGFQIVPTELGGAFCFGDGGNQAGCTDCPCGNNAPQGSGGGCLNLSGTSGRLLSSGTPSVGSDTLRFEARALNTNTFAVLASGLNRLPANMASPCFGLDSGTFSVDLDGLRCIGGNFRRHGTRATDASGDVGLTNAGWGPPDGPPAGLIAQNGFAAGQTRHFQLYYRTDPTMGCGTSQQTSNGYTIDFVP